MGRILRELREVIARNIRNCRLKNFPGRGGQLKCAAAFSDFIGKNVSPQQWSPWERGMRTPDEYRLETIAKFFNVTVEFLRKDHAKPILGAPPLLGSIVGQQEPPPISSNVLCDGLPSLTPDQPGSTASFFWLAQRLVNALATDGIRIRLDRDSAELLANLLMKKERQ